MSTTNLFVELLVIGVGAFAWLALLLMTALGIDLAALQSLFTSPVAAIPALAIVYLLGIVTDRIADRAFHLLRVEAKQRTKYPGGSDQYFQDRWLVLGQSEQFAQFYEYSRSRQRICRGWALNSIAISIALYVGSIVHSDAWLPVTVPCAFLLALALCCWWAWEALHDAELARIQAQAQVLGAAVDKTTTEVSGDAARQTVTAKAGAAA